MGGNLNTHLLLPFIKGLSSKPSSMLEKVTSSGPLALQTSWLEKGTTKGCEQAIIDYK